MEPRREDQPQAPPSAQPKPKRFRIVKLEERIAPNKGGIPGKPGTYIYCSNYTCVTWCA